MFSTPNFRIHSQENENVTARKGNLTESVTRKAFTDRNVNQTLLKNNQFPMKNKLAEIKTPKLRTVETKYPDWLLDKCRYKEIEDTYEDIIPSSLRLSKKDVSNIVKAQTKRVDREPKLSSLQPIEKPKYDLDPFVLDLPTPREQVRFDFTEEEFTMPTPPMFNFDY